MTPALVSILIPAYNAQRWIAQTLHSAVAQTWPNIEIIVVDDGSTDGTLAVAKSFQSFCVRVYSQANRGASAARNKALSFAKGEFIQWLDADDLLARDKIEQQMRAVDCAKATLLSSEVGLFLVDPAKAWFSPNPLWQNLSPTEFFLNKFTDNAWMNPANWLVSRQITEAAGGWDERLSLDDDGEYFSRVVATSQQIKFVPGARSYYRQGNLFSLSRETSDQACESLLLSLQLCIGHLLALENSERTRRASLAFLQNWVDRGSCFFPDRLDAYERIAAIALHLGGELRSPHLDWRYASVQWLFGWKGVRAARLSVSRTRHLLRLSFNKLYLSINKKNIPPAID